MSFQIAESKVGSITLLAPKGTLVLGNETEAFARKVQALLDGGETGIILDLGEVTYVDSSGISALIRSHIAASRRGASVKLVRLTRRVNEVLQITKLNSVFEIYDDLQNALMSFPPPSAGTDPPTQGT